MKRVGKSGMMRFWRNAFVSFTSVLVIAIALFMIGKAMFGNYALEAALNDLQERVDINVYFVTDASEDEILSLKAAIENQPEVAAVTYTSRSEALEKFRERHQDNEATMQALEELGENPLAASLAIRAKETSQYEGLAQFLNEREASVAPEDAIIDNINYFQNKTAIDRISALIEDTRSDNTLQVALLALIAIFVSFNTIRLAIYNSREEIGVMRLVGAGNFYISAPFIVSGILQGIVAAVIVLLLFYPALYYFEGAFQPFPFFGDAGYEGILFSYYLERFGYVFAVIVGSGAAIGAISSLLAVRRYLKI